MAYAIHPRMALTYAALYGEAIGALTAEVYTRTLQHEMGPNYWRPAPSPVPTILHAETIGLPSSRSQSAILSGMAAACSLAKVLRHKRAHLLS